MLTLAAFSLGFALEKGGGGLTAAIPPLVGAALFWNGTRACYYGLLLLYAGAACYLLLERLLLKKPRRLLLLSSLLLTLFAAAALYPVSPRVRVDAIRQAGLEETPLLSGDLDFHMEAEPKGDDGLPADPAKRTAYMDALYRRCLSSYPDLYRRFGMERVQRHYRYTADPAVLRSGRLAERSYAHLIWEDTDKLTKLLGFEASQMGVDGHYDMENDWHALFYYYGYLGLALYAGFVLAILLCILRAARADLRRSLTPLNFTLTICLALQLGLAHFSGALLRRPNVSVYLSLVLALIWYQTRKKEPVS